MPALDLQLHIQCQQTFEALLQVMFMQTWRSFGYCCGKLSERALLSPARLGIAGSPSGIRPLQPDQDLPQICSGRNLNWQAGQFEMLKQCNV